MDGRPDQLVPVDLRAVHDQLTSRTIDPVFATERIAMTASMIIRRWNEYTIRRVVAVETYAQRATHAHLRPPPI